MLLESDSLTGSLLSSARSADYYVTGPAWHTVGHMSSTGRSMSGEVGKAPMSKRTKAVKFEMTLPEELDQKVLEWRRNQPDLPTRNEALRRLILMGLGKNKEEKDG